MGATSDARLIDEELRKNGVKINTDAPGLEILKHAGFEVEVSPNVARGTFYVGEPHCQPFGVLQGSMTGLLAESMVSIVAKRAANGQQVHSVEMNANHVRAVPMGEKVVGTARPLLKGGRIQLWEVTFEKEVKKKTGGPIQMAVAAIIKITLLVGSAIEPIDWGTNVKESRL